MVLSGPVLLLLGDFAQLLHILSLADYIVEQDQLFKLFGDLEAFLSDINESM